MTETVELNLEGNAIKEVRKMTEEEMEGEFWEANHHSPPKVIVLEDGTKLYPSQDSEGNSFGQMFGETSEGDKFYL
jgi:hypothetical protein